MKTKVLYKIIWSVDGSMISDGFIKKSMAKKALKDYLSFHCVVKLEEKNEYKIESY